MMAVVGLCAVALLRFGIPTAIACFFGLYVFIVGGVMWLFMQLRAVES